MIQKEDLTITWVISLWLTRIPKHWYTYDSLIKRKTQALMSLILMIQKEDFLRQ